MPRQIEDDDGQPVAQPKLDQVSIQARMGVVAMEDEQRSHRRLIRAGVVMTGDPESRRLEGAEVVLDVRSVLGLRAGKVENIEVEVVLWERGDNKRGYKVDADQAVSPAFNIGAFEQT